MGIRFFIFPLKSFFPGPATKASISKLTTPNLLRISTSCFSIFGILGEPHIETGEKAVGKPGTEARIVPRGAIRLEEALEIFPVTFLSVSLCRGNAVSPLCFHAISKRIASRRRVSRSGPNVLCIKMRGNGTWKDSRPENRAPL